MAKRSMFVGMDVHKESIDVSLAEEGRDGEVRHYGVIPGDLEAVAKVVRALRAPARRLRFVYEAGPCGFGLHRYLTGQGEDCVVVNPSSMPKRSGDRIKTDRRDGDVLARLHRAGELIAIYIPTPEDAALRDLVRAREDAVGLSTQAKHRLNAFLLRQGRRYPGRAGWTRPYRRGWPTSVSRSPPSTSRCRSTATRSTKPTPRGTPHGPTCQLTPAWRWAPSSRRGCAASRCHGGRSRREVGDIRRHTHPRQLMVQSAWSRREQAGRASAAAGSRRESALTWPKPPGPIGRPRPADDAVVDKPCRARLRHRLKAAVSDVTVSEARGARESETQGGHRGRA